jgi:hypothetical protein
VCFLVLLGFQHVILSCAGALIDVANMMRRRYDELNCVMKHTRTQEAASSPSGPRCSQTLTASPRPTNRELQGRSGGTEMDWSELPEELMAKLLEVL